MLKLVVSVGALDGKMSKFTQKVSAPYKDFGEEAKRAIHTTAFSQLP